MSQIDKPESHSTNCAEGDDMECGSVGSESESDSGLGRDLDTESIHSEVEAYDY
jgi:hypothetical protein